MVYDIVLKSEIPAFHASDESDAGLGLLCSENVDYNCVVLFRSQTDKGQRYAVCGYDTGNSEYHFDPDVHELNSTVVDDAVTVTYAVDRNTAMVEFVRLQTAMLLEANRLLRLRDMFSDAF